ncbi:MAG: carboxypeptidase-like regulatory domain-containing protein [Prevotellaceae bacterium]|jgi:hypothetical protein|nr:carboxypeptidase-like regulatory domain-containing protein [Prevotellaceae bacterium]
MKRILTLLTTVFITVYCANAQTNDKKWTEIDTLFANGLYKTAIEKLNVIYAQSLKNGNDVQLVKVIIYRLACQQYTDENVNVAKINALYADLGKAKSDVAKALINSLLGEAIFNYFQQNRWRYYNRTDVNDDKSNSDVTTWSLNRILDECSDAFKRSLTNSNALGKIKLDYINDILIENKETREYRPTLYDFIAHRAIQILGNSETRITSPKDVFLPNDENLFTCDAEQFAKMQITGSDSASNLLFALNILQQLTKFHLQQKNIIAVGNITLERFSFLLNNSTLQNKKTLVMSNLQKFVDSSEKNNIWFEASYMLAKMYKENGEETKAVAICETAIRQKNIGEKQKNTFERYIKYVKYPSINLNVERINIPLQPVKALVKYKDVDTVYFRIYSVPTEHQITMLTMSGRLETDKEKFIEKNALPVKEWQVKMPTANDHKTHTTEIACDFNPSGQSVFILVASSSPDFFNASEKIIECAIFQLSSISYVYRNLNTNTNEIYLADRMTGKPLQNAKFRIFDSNMKLKNEYTSDSQGSIKNAVSVNYGNIVTVTDKSNSLIEINSPISLNRYSAFNFKDDDDIITKFFLDRAIYRPGQTVYFKGIILDYKDNKYSIAVGEKEEVTLNDTNDEELASIDVVSNEYGTFNGSFVLPQSVLGGRFTIQSDYGEIGFYVEEYKRPTFEVTVNPAEKNYKFNETVHVSGIAKSYAGYSIDNAKVSYSITQKIEFPYRWWNYHYNSRTKTVGSGETTTDENGNFNIEFFADDSEIENDMQIAVYIVSFDVTDNNGETRKAEYGLRIGKKPLIIEADIPETANINDSLSFNLFTKNLNGNQTEADITVKIYSLKQPEKLLRKRLWDKPDKHVMSYEEYKKLFPYDVYEDEDEIEKFEETGLVKTLSFNTNNTKKINLDELKQYGNASYRIDITAKNPENITTETKMYMQLQSPDSFTDMKNWGKKGKQTEKEIEFFVGGIGDNMYVHYDITYRNDLIESKNIITAGKTSENIKIKIPETKNNEEFLVSFVSIFNNRVYTSKHTVKPREDKRDLDISLVTFRDKLQPGEKEQWKLRIKYPNNEKAMAEMVATLYDASLDAFAMHDWNKNFGTSSPLNYYYSDWHVSNVHGLTYSLNIYNIYVNSFFPNIKYERLITSDYIKRHANYIKNINKITEKKGKIAGIVVDEHYELLPYVSVYLKNNPTFGTLTDESGEFEISAKKGDVLVFSHVGYITQEVVVHDDVLSIVLSSDANMLEENVVAAYSMVKKVAIRGVARLGELLEGEVAGIAADMDTVFEMEEDYKNVELRTNFNETAFFYPELRTDENGEIIIDFVIPESLTRWKLLGLAHTKSLETGKITEYAVTQKEVAISANAPRFFRNGDNIEFSAKINNITENSLKGKAQLLLFDAFTMQPISITDAIEQNFEVNSNQSTAVKWNLNIPSNIEAITYRLLATTDKHSDGEEKTIPVLPNSMLVTESLPFTVRANQSRDFKFEKLINNISPTLKNYGYTLEFTSNPVWYAVQAMPYMMEYPYECSEQIFSRFYANSLSSVIIDKFPQIRRTFDLWKMKDSKELISNLEKNQELKNILIEETPWLREAKDESENKKRIALLFDLNKMQNEQKSTLNKLKHNQMGNGAFPWFGGMCESRYITQHIAIGLQRLKKLNAVADIYISDVDKISNAAIKYLDGKMLLDYEYLLKNKAEMSKYEVSEIILHYLYLRSFKGTADMSQKEKTAFDYFFNRIDRNPFDRGIYQQALIALTAYRLGKGELAQKIVNSLKERAQVSEEMGMYWAENSRGYFWYQSPIETQSLLIETFTEIGNNKKEIDEMKIWLLRNKHTNNWETTKATSDACYALLIQNDNITTDNLPLQVKLNNYPLEQLKNDDLQKSETATGYVKTSWRSDEIKNDFGKINVTNPNATIAWGAAYWQYFENLDKITSADTELKIKREYFIEKHTDSGAKLNRIDENNAIKVGDKIKVRIELRADRDYEYVHLKDMRASGLEPINVISQAKYQDGMWYYESTKDASSNFFIYYLKKGTYVFEYELTANSAGEFSTGIATIQCMYAPEFSAHSAGEKIIIKPADF